MSTPTDKAVIDEEAREKFPNMVSLFEALDQFSAQADFVEHLNKAMNSARAIPTFENLAADLLSQIEESNGSPADMTEMSTQYVLFVAFLTAALDRVTYLEKLAVDKSDGELLACNAELEKRNKDLEDHIKAFAQGGMS